MPDIFKINPTADINKSNIILGVPGTGYKYISSTNLNTGNNHTFSISNPIGSGLTIVGGRLSSYEMGNTHLISPDPDMIFPISGEFPSINAGERLVRTYNIGNIGYQNRVMVIFFNSEVASYGSIKNAISNVNQISNCSPYGCINLFAYVSNKNKPVPYFFNTAIANTPTASSLIIYRNYNYSSRFSGPNNTFERYGSGIGTALDQTNSIGYGGVFNYTSLGNILIGWQSGGAGISMYSGYKVEMQGAWISDSGNKTLLNFAYVNNGTITAPSSGIWMGVYLL